MENAGGYRKAKEDIARKAFTYTFMYKYNVSLFNNGAKKHFLAWPLSHFDEFKSTYQQFITTSTCIELENVGGYRSQGLTHLLNCSNGEYIHCLDVYTRSLFMSIVQRPFNWDRLVLAYTPGIEFSVLTAFRFPYVLAPPFSTAAFSTPAFHSCIFHSRIFSAPFQFPKVQL